MTNMYNHEPRATSHEPRATSHEPRATSHEPHLCPKFSIIIPVYNCGKFIARALDSLINQDIPDRNYEIIITDDGSTDNTGAICDAYANKFPFIHVTHTENFGPSHARNIALPQCRGEYVTFCDADDFVSPHMFSVLTAAEEALHSPDMMSWQFFLNESPEGWPEYCTPEEILSGSETTDGSELIFRILFKIGGYSWSKAVRRDKAEGIFFDEDIILCEDEIWFARIASRTPEMRVCYLNCYLYSYTRLPDFGLCRTSHKIPNSSGIHRMILPRLRMLSIPNIPFSIANIVRCKLYLEAMAYLRSDNKLSEKSRSDFHECLRKYYPAYYSSRRFSVKAKVKMFIKHILVLLHVHKPHR